VSVQNTGTCFSACWIFEQVPIHCKLHSKGFKLNLIWIVWQPIVFDIEIWPVLPKPLYWKTKLWQSSTVTVFH